MMKSKIHRARVTDAHLDYVGSISLDPQLMNLADILVGEQVAIVDIDNGARFETYAIEGRPGDVCLNGAAARLVHPGDKVIVITYADYNATEIATYEPIVVHVDESNIPISEDVASKLAGGPMAPPARPLRGSSSDQS
ncbi:MAG: aspartate 1-decarboxylase [Actinomycetes bacterium]|jgi:aspartate 1-decarboxylase